MEVERGTQKLLLKDRTEWNTQNSMFVWQSYYPHPTVILLISIKIIDKVVFTKTSRVLVTKGGADLGKSLAEQGESLSRANHALNIWLDYGPTVKHCDSSDIYNLHFS